MAHMGLNIKVSDLPGTLEEFYMAAKAQLAFVILGTHKLITAFEYGQTIGRYRFYRKDRENVTSRFTEKGKGARV